MRRFADSGPAAQRLPGAGREQAGDEGRIGSPSAGIHRPQPPGSAFPPRPAGGGAGFRRCAFPRANGIRRLSPYVLPAGPHILAVPGGAQRAAGAPANRDGPEYRPVARPALHRRRLHFGCKVSPEQIRITMHSGLRFPCSLNGICSRAGMHQIRIGNHGRMTTVAARARAARQGVPDIPRSETQPCSALQWPNELLIRTVFFCGSCGSSRGRAALRQRPAKKEAE